MNNIRESVIRYLDYLTKENNITIFSIYYNKYRSFIINGIYCIDIPDKYTMDDVRKISDEIMAYFKNHRFEKLIKELNICIYLNKI